MVAMQFSTQGIVPEFGYGGGTLWKDGWTKVMIKDTAVRDNNDKSTGQHLGCTLVNELGEEGYLAVNVYHSKPEVRSRADQQMTALLWVLHLTSMTATEQLHGIPFYIENKVQTYTPPGQQQAKQRNNFTSVRDINGLEPGKDGGSAVGQQPQAPQPPQPPQFGQPPAQAGYGQPPQPGFGQPPAQPAFAPPAQPAFGTPPAAPGFGAPPAPGFPQQPGFAPAPAAPSFGQPPAPAAGWAPPQQQPQQQQQPQTGAAPAWNPGAGAPMPAGAPAWNPNGAR